MAIDRDNAATELHRPQLLIPCEAIGMIGDFSFKAAPGDRCGGDAKLQLGARMKSPG